MQVKVNLSMETLGQVQAEQHLSARAVKGPGPPPLAIPARDPASIIEPRPPQPPPPPPPPGDRHAPRVTFPSATATPTSRASSSGNSEFNGEENKKGWMPKMDFPKFHGEDVRIWVDTCNTFFQLYSIAEGFKVSAATMYMRDSAAHWYQAYKQTSPWHDWPMFCEAVLAEFEGNTQRDKTRELLTLCQTGYVEEYKRQFDILVYQIKLYDPHIGGMMLVQQFILGLKEELRTTVEVQLPNSVAEAAAFAAVQEGVLERAKGVGKSTFKKHLVGNGKDNSGVGSFTNKFEKGELWKARQLKDYRTANELCFKCGEKYAPRHQCTMPVLMQAKAMEATEILFDEILDQLENSELAECHVSVNALSGSTDNGTIQLQTLVGNQTVLLLIDSGSSHSFIDQNMVNQLNLTTHKMAATRVKVANGEVVMCNKVVPAFTWWVQGNTFSQDMKVLNLGGYDGILGMDWLKQWGLM
uniref:Uncharacterized protein n=1 Tax=Avena sativa TaxID=4498 RepID=A0ACD6AAU5_AVESA